MLRSGLLALSRSRTLPRVLTRLPVARRLPRRFVAGQTLAEAVGAVRELNARGLLATVDHLGENVSTAADARRAAREYGQVLEAIEGQSLEAGISIKLTHLGLELGKDVCLQNCRRVLARAGGREHWVEIDMEGSAYTQATLEVFHELHTGYNRLGICVQAYLHRTEGDLEGLIARGAKVRLCKGAYAEPPEVAFRRKEEIDGNYLRLLERLFSPEARSRGVFPAVATHDLRLIDWVRERVQRGLVGREGFEFQMLYGVRRDLQQELAGQGYALRVYVPFGQEWYPYWVRRLAERPANLLFLLRQLLDPH